MFFRQEIHPYSKFLRFYMLKSSHSSLMCKQYVYLFTFTLGAVKTCHQFTNLHSAYGVIIWAWPWSFTPLLMLIKTLCLVGFVVWNTCRVGNELMPHKCLNRCRGEVSCCSWYLAFLPVVGGDGSVVILITFQRVLL